MFEFPKVKIKQVEAEFFSRSRTINLIFLSIQQQLILRTLIQSSDWWRHQIHPLWIPCLRCLLQLTNHPRDTQTKMEPPSRDQHIRNLITIFAASLVFVLLLIGAFMHCSQLGRKSHSHQWPFFCVMDMALEMTVLPKLLETSRLRDSWHRRVVKGCPKLNIYFTYV